MGGLDCLFVLFAVFQIITSQEFGPRHGPPPEWANNKCAGPPPGVKNPQSCCQMKPIFTEEELASCGFQKIEEEQRKGPPKPPDCSKQECLLKSKGCLNEDNSINYKAVEAHLTSWAEPEWEPALKAAVGFCLGENGVPGPPHICEANRMMFCIGGVFFSECPSWEDSDDCKRLKDHMTECRPPN